MDTHEILNKLYAGKRITLQFNNAADVERFRNNIYKMKGRQDAQVQATLEEERQSLRFIVRDMIAIAVGEKGTYHVTIWMEDKKPLNYSIISIEDNGDTESGRGNTSGTGEKIPENLGRTSPILPEASKD